jgi:hypothetical protein
MSGLNRGRREGGGLRDDSRPASFSGGVDEGEVTSSRNAIVACNQSSKPGAAGAQRV